jgi:ppGpp synthetase/RelA/SpoT-type nucleotidyltranferase
MKLFSKTWRTISFFIKKIYYVSFRKKNIFDFKNVEKIDYISRTENAGYLNIISFTYPTTTLIEAPKRSIYI